MKNEGKLFEILPSTPEYIPKYKSVRFTSKNFQNNNITKERKGVNDSPNYIIADVNMLSKLFTNLVRSTCKNTSLCVLLRGKYGFSHKLKVVSHVTFVNNREMKLATKKKMLSVMAHCYIPLLLI